ncbi:unnamed protein product [Durusdinium trenchii]|uniref:Uncharacterized protein n=1 Tax=Durusdinium trenchii TaxID=1381693 RepID=A0ABP0ILF1_9DINO
MLKEVPDPVTGFPLRWEAAKEGAAVVQTDHPHVAALAPSALGRPGHASSKEGGALQQSEANDEAISDAVGAR